MQYPIIDLIADAYLSNGWTGFDIPNTITYEPIQVGSGDPSPDNIRPIFPATTLNIGGVDIPVYGGTLNINNGSLIVDMANVDLSTMSWGMSTWGSANVFSFSGSAIQSALNENAICSKYRKVSVTDIYNNRVNYAFCANVFGENVNYRFIDNDYDNVTAFTNSLNGTQFVYELATPITYQLTPTELENAIGIKDDIAYRLKLPLPHYFPHPVIDALQRAAAGTQTADDTEVLRHYLTPLGIGGI